jgi:hypothetical protein
VDHPADPRLPAPVPARASDRDRDRTIAALNDASASGRLGAEDHDARLDRALAAITMADLAALIIDLPLTRDADGLPIVTAVARVDGRFGKVVRQVVPEVTPEIHAVARFGQVVLDLRAMSPDSAPVLITADSFAGQVKVLLPSGARVVDTGSARFGNRKASGHLGAPDAGPLVYVQGTTRFGQLKCIPEGGPDRRGQLGR